MTLQLREGGYYLDGVARVIGPMELFQPQGYTWISRNPADGQRTYTDNGVFFIGGLPNNSDLIQECTPDGTPIMEKAMTPKYDEAKVDELLAAIEEWRIHDLSDRQPKTGERFVLAFEALRPKPVKFHTMPTWEEFAGDCQKHQVSEHLWIFRKHYNELREATASDKPLVHIPAGSEWRKEDLNDLLNEYSRKIGSSDYSGTIAVIDVIKAKLESKCGKTE